MVSPATGKACELEMMKTSQLSLAKQKQLAKFDCIDIWRTEVKASRMHCMCSASTVEVKKPAVSESSWAVKTPSTFTASMTSAPYKSLLKLATPSVSREDDETASASASASASATAPTPARESKASGFSLGGKRSRSRGGCPVCSLPTDAVVYMPIGSDEYGFMWAPRPLSSIKSLEQMWRTKEKKGKELLSKISPSFLRPKKVIIPPSDESTEPSDTTSLDGDFPRKTTATEMYRSLRRQEPEGTGKDAEDDEKIEDPLSNSDGKKLPISIEEIGARLRRAKKLLDKSVASNSASKKSSVNIASAMLQPRYRSST